MEEEMTAFFGWFYLAALAAVLFTLSALGIREGIMQRRKQ